MRTTGKDTVELIYSAMPHRSVGSKPAKGDLLKPHISRSRGGDRITKARERARKESETNGMCAQRSVRMYKATSGGSHPFNFAINLQQAASFMLPKALTQPAAAN